MLLRGRKASDRLQPPCLVQPLKARATSSLPTSPIAMPEDFMLVSKQIWQRMRGRWKVDTLDMWVGVRPKSLTLLCPPLPSGVGLAPTPEFWCFHSPPPTSSWFHTGKRAHKVLFLLFERCIPERSALPLHSITLGSTLIIDGFSLAVSEPLPPPARTDHIELSHGTCRGPQTKGADNQQPN